MRKSQFEQISHKRLLFILGILSFFLLMFGNGLLSLTHPDEVFYILSAREMVQHNSWLTPLIFDHVQFEKPFLSYTLFAFAIKLFGEGPFIARFWPAFAGIIGVGIVYWMAWMLFNRKKIAFMSALILCTSIIYVVLSRAVLTDMIFTTLISCSIAFFYLALNNPQQHKRGIIWGFFFSALAVLTKGLLGFFFPILTVIFYIIWMRKLKNVNWGWIILGFIFFLMLVVPWHIQMYKNAGSFFIQEYFQNVHVRRLFESEHPEMSTWYFYPVIILFGVLPWSFFGVLTFKKIILTLKEQSHHSEAVKFLLGWVICVFFPVQLAASKLASYLFPAFPALSILLGYAIIVALDEKLEKTPERRSVKLAGWLTFAFFNLVAIGCLMLSRELNFLMIPKKTFLIIAGMLVFAAVVVIVFCYQKEYARMIAGIMSFVPIIIIGLVMAVPQLETWVSCQKICDAFKAINRPQELIFSSKILSRAVHFYTGNPVAVIDINGNGFWSKHPIPYFNLDQKIIDYMNKNKELYAIIRDKTMEDFERLSQSQPYDIEELYSAGGKKIIHMLKRQ